MVYKWDKGSRFSVSAQVAGEVCEELEKKGELTAKNLVDVSRPEDAPLHKCFNWNDEEAMWFLQEHISTLSETNRNTTALMSFLKIKTSMKQ